MYQTKHHLADCSYVEENEAATRAANYLEFWHKNIFSAKQHLVTYLTGDVGLPICLCKNIFLATVVAIVTFY